jgi:hypothetical protein
MAICAMRKTTMINRFGVHEEASEAIEEAISFLVDLDLSLRESDPELEMAVIYGEDLRSLLSRTRDLKSSLNLTSTSIAHDLWERKQQKQKSPKSSSIGQRA